MCVLHTDGTFHCDCRVEYLGLFCRERDPCKFGGDNDCLNGGTCVRANDIEYECECRVPFVGDQCEEEDLCTIDVGECVDDLVPTQKCFPCEVTETCKKLSVNEYSCDPKEDATTIRPHGGNPVDIVFVYPKAARLNQEATFKMRFPRSTINLNWFFDDRPYINIDATNCDNIPPVIGVPSDWAPYLFCSFKRPFPIIKTYEIHAESTGIPASTEKGTISIYENCIPSVRIHNLGHQEDYKNIEVDEIYTPIPEYSRGSTVRAWSTVYMDCEPQERRVQICSVDFEWRFNDEAKVVQDGTGHEFAIETDNLPTFGIHTIYVGAKVRFNERNLDCSGESLAQVTAIVHDQGTFELIRSNPVAIIEGGYERVLDQSTSITLDGSKSYDPEDSASVHPLTFTWTCTTFTILVGLAPTTSMPCATRAGIFTPTPTFTFVPGLLQIGRYTFQLEVTSTVPGAAGGQGRAMQDVVVANSRVLDYSITCIRNCENGNTWTNRENKVVLKCQCTKCNLGPNQWDLKVKFADLKNRIIPAVDYIYEFEKSVVDPSIDQSQVYIQIDPNPPPSIIAQFVTATNPNPELTLIFTCTSKGDKLAKAEIHLEPMSNLPKPRPIPGTVPSPPCTIHPSTTPAYAFKDKFKIVCAEFETSSPPLTFTLYAKIRAERGRGKLHEYEYDYGYPIMHEKTMLLSADIEYKNIFPYYEFLLPAGHPQDGYKLPLTVKVSDAQGLASYYSISQEVRPMSSPKSVLLDWYLGERSLWKGLIQAKNHVRILQHALAYFHYASVADPLTISMDEKQGLTSLKTTHMSQLLQMSKNSIHQIEHVTSVAFAIIQGDYDKPEHSLSGGALILAARLSESLGKELIRVLRPRSRGRVSSKTDLYDSPMMDSVIKAGITTVMGIIEPLNLLHHEFFLDRDFSEVVPEFRATTVNLDTVEGGSTRLLEALQYFADSLGSLISITQTAIAFPPKGYFAIFVQIVHETELPEKRAPIYDPRFPTLLQGNYVQLSTYTKVDLSAGNALKFVQLTAIVSMFNPFLVEKIQSDDIKRGMNIETPIFVFEAKDDFDLRKLPAILEDSSFPHVFQLSYFDVDHTATNMQTHEVGLINIDVFSVPDVDRHAYLLTLPPRSTFMVAVDVFGARNIDLHVVVTKNRRPSCQDLFDQSSSNALVAFGDRIGGVAYSITTNDLDERVSRNQALENPNCPDCSDYYIIMWPTVETNIPVALKKKPTDSLDVHIGFSQLKCFSKPEISGTGWGLDCSAGASLEPTAGLTCNCQHLSVIGSSLVNLQSRNQDFIKFDLFSELDDNMLIPYIVISFLICYALFLAIAIYVDIANYKRPKLIIFGDIKRIRVDTVYLLTVETGNDYFGGTTAKVLCQVFGDKAKTKPMVLSNYILDTMRENDEQSFLISCPEPLGNLLSIHLSHDNSGPTPSWFCRRVIIRNVKTDETWFFFVERWISAWKGNASLSCSIPLATPVEVQKRFANKFTWRGYWRQLREHHLWFCPITCPARSDFKRCERFTCLMVGICSYLLVNLLLYRIPKKKYDGGIIHFEPVHFSQYDPIFSNGTKGSLCGVWVGIFVTEAFRLLKRKMVPALIVFDGVATIKDGVSSNDSIEATQEAEVVKPVTVTEQVQVVLAKVKSKLSLRRRQTEVITSVKQPESVVFRSPSRRKKSKDKGGGECSCFRIPSTDIIKTEKWIGDMNIDEESLVTNLAETLQYDTDFVHRYSHPKRGKCDSCSNQVNKVFYNRSKIPNPRRLGPTVRYTPNECVSSTQNLKEIRGRCISRTTRKIPYTARLLSSYTETLADPARKQMLCGSSKCVCGSRKAALSRTGYQATKSKDKSVVWETRGREPSPLNSVQVQTSRSYTFGLDQASKSEAAPIPQPSVDEPEVGQVLLNEETIKYELGSILYMYQHCHPLPYRPFIYLAWALCLTIIIVFSALTIYYGARFGWVKSLDWSVSMVYTFLESILIIQPLKALIYYGIIIFSARRKGVNADQIIVKTRFKLIWMAGLTDPIKIWPLNYLIHPIRIDELSGLPKDYVIVKSGFSSTGHRHHRRRGRRNFQHARNSKGHQDSASRSSSEADDISDFSESSQEEQKHSSNSNPKSKQSKPPTAGSSGKHHSR